MLELHHEYGTDRTAQLNPALAHDPLQLDCITFEALMHMRIMPSDLFQLGLCNTLLGSKHLLMGHHLQKQRFVFWSDLFNTNFSAWLLGLAQSISSHCAELSVGGSVNNI